MTFQPNAFYERLIQMRRTDKKMFDSLSTPTHYALIEYEKQKREHKTTEEARLGMACHRKG
jgi:hypothetical protein